LAWSHSGHQLAYLEDGFDKGALLTVVNPETLEVISSIIASEPTAYIAQSYAYIIWSPDGEAIAVRNNTRLDLYFVDSQLVHQVVEGVDLHYEPGVGTPSVAWIGNTHRITYPPHNEKDGVMLWVYNPDNGERTMLAKQADYGIFYSPDASYALLDTLGADGRRSTLLLNLLTQRSIIIRENASILQSGWVYWLETRNQIVLQYQDMLLWMGLDGTTKHELKIATRRLSFNDNAQNLFVYTAPLTQESDGAAEIGIIDLDTGSRHRLGELFSDFGNIYISPDGRVIGFETDGDHTKNGVTLALFASDGSWSRIVHTKSGDFLTPLWSPDSTKVAMLTYIYRNKNTVHILTAQGEQLKQIDLPPKDLSFTIWNNCEIP
jgi:hypothetical protein